MTSPWSSSWQVSTAEEIIRHFQGQPADLVVCDGAPDGEASILLPLGLFAIMSLLLSYLHSNGTARRGRVHPGSTAIGCECTWCTQVYVCGCHPADGFFSSRL